MFEIQSDTQSLQVMEFSQYGDLIMFTALPAKNPQGPSESGVIYTRNKSVVSVELSGIKRPTPYFIKWVFNKANNGPLSNQPINWVSALVGNLGYVVIDLVDQTLKERVVTVSYAHKLSDYLTDTSKLYYMALSLAGVTSVRLADNSLLKRVWLDTDRISPNGDTLKRPAWIYEKWGVTYTDPIVRFVSTISI